MAENGKAKYYALMEEMKTDILSGKIRPGEKLPSENQLSVRYGLSRHTVRKALGILAGDGYIESFQGKGTFCADVLRQIHGTGNIAVVTTYISDYIFPRLIQGIDEVLSDNGYSIILKNTGNSRQKEARFLEELISKGIDGLIIEPSKSELLCRHVSLYETLDKYQIPYIFIQGLYTEMQEKPHILMDDAGGGYLVTKHLLDSGRRNIAGFFKADDRQGIERHKGYVKALQEHGIAYDPDKVVWFHTEDRREKPALMVRNMVRQNSFPDGIVCYNDQIAVQVMEELERQGKKIPEDVAFADSRIRPETIAAEDVLHDMGIFSMMSSDSQAMGRVGEVITRTWQTASKMKDERGALPEDEGKGNDNFRVKRYIAKYTINPAITHGIADYVGSVEKGKFADLVLWNPAFFGAKPDIIIKGGMIIASKMGDANASIPTTQPVMYQPMFAAHGKAKNEACLTFVSQAAYDAGIKDIYGLEKTVVPVKGCRNIAKKDMVFNNRTPKITVDPETYEVTVDGEAITSKPAEKLPLTQLYNLF